jgi:hypothetical protein
MGPIIDDLRIEAESTSKSQRPGAAVPITLQFFNQSPNPRVLFLIAPENYRFGQSVFRFKVRSGPTQVQPISREGYVPKSTDFHEIAPNGQLSFTQTLHLARTTPTGELTVEWTYQNAIDCWPSKMSNGGQPIPGIWRGKLVTNFTVAVGR